MLKRLTSRAVLPIAVFVGVVFGFGSAAHADPVPVSPGDTFSVLVQEHCGTSNWQSVSFPGRNKNLIFAGETIDLTCVSATPALNAPVSVPQAQVICPGWTPNFWDDEQRANAAIILQVGVDRGISRRGLIIALMAAMQESSLHNYGYLGTRNDHDSQGLFQQRPSMGWGTVAQVTDPVYASNKFYDVLMTVRNWQSIALTQAVQAVQISAYPNAYAKWEADATGLVAQIACQ